MSDIKLVQSLGNLAARDIESRYPGLEIRFFALKDGSQARIHITRKGDALGQTGRLYDIGKLPEVSTLAVKDVSRLLENRIEELVGEFGVQR